MASVLFGFLFTSGVGRRLGKDHPVCIGAALAAASEWMVDESTSRKNLDIGTLAAREA